MHQNCVFEIGEWTTKCDSSKPNLIHGGDSFAHNKRSSCEKIQAEDSNCSQELRLAGFSLFFVRETQMGLVRKI